MSSMVPARITETLPSKPVASAVEVRNTIEALRSQANVLTPTVVMDFIPQMHRVSFGAVMFDTGADGKSKDVYHTNRFLKDNERAPSKTGLLKILSAAGWSIVESRRTDDRKDPLFCEYQVMIEGVQLDGNRTRIVGTKAVDLRDGSGQTAAMKDRQLAQERANIDTLAETKALLRAIRAAFSLSQKYTVEELNRPFIIPKLVPDLDTSDPVVRQLVAAKALGITGTLYGPDKRAIEAPEEEVRTVTVADDDYDTETGEVRETATAEDDRNPTQAISRAVGPIGDDDLGGAPPAPAAAAQDHVCTCPCGCQGSITADLAAKSTEQVGAPRCKLCYPARFFDYHKHMHLNSLKLPKYPNGMTPIEADNHARAARDKAGAK